MSETVYDVPISEVAKILDKSDRQVRRYVKERRIKAKPIRVDGHIKLMFNRDEVVAFRDKTSPESRPEPEQEIVIVGQVVEGSDGGGETGQEADAEAAGDETSNAVKYVVDALKDQIRELRTENKDLHYQLEQRSGQVGFLQGKIEALQEEIKMLAPAPKPEKSEERSPWYKRIFGK